MKYGVIYYNNTHNLGDDILSYAGKQFLPQVDYYIDREHLDVFIPNEKEYVATIANGWFLHNCYTFQPSPYIHPLFIGTHFLLMLFFGKIMPILTMHLPNIYNSMVPLVAVTIIPLIYCKIKVSPITFLAV